jgi:hypothetical protein
MEKVSHYEIVEYTYENRNERDSHVSDLYLDGWIEEGKVKRLKNGVSLLDATENDYEWYARFIRFK